MNNSLMWLMIANCVIWLLLSAYVGYMALSQKRLARQCDRLERMLNDAND